MVAFDTLGYSKRLRDAGLEQPTAEAAAEAARDYIMTNIVTKDYLREALDTMTLRLTVRLGGILAAGIAILAAILKLA
jgi:hypothetical protein